MAKQDKVDGEKKDYLQYVEGYEPPVQNPAAIVPTTETPVTSIDSPTRSTEAPANVLKAQNRTVPGFTFEEGGKFYHDFRFMQFTDTQFGLNEWLREIKKSSEKMDPVPDLALQEVIRKDFNGFSAKKAYEKEKENCLGLVSYMNKEKKGISFAVHCGCRCPRKALWPGTASRCNQITPRRG